ncbi:hypothetical protein K438DRAFT_1768180 [Mycena galopus ATCC 62051]|nr:hypothetical protein K438DRAFT_1768180 [Mycena galopus ATCC 62051]
MSIFFGIHLGHEKVRATGSINSNAPVPLLKISVEITPFRDRFLRLMCGRSGVHCTVRPELMHPDALRNLTKTREKGNVSVHFKYDRGEAETCGLGIKKPGSVGGCPKPRMFNKLLTATILAILVLGQEVVSVPQNLPCTSSSTLIYSRSLNSRPALYDAFSFMISGDGLNNLLQAPRASSAVSQAHSPFPDPHVSDIARVARAPYESGEKSVGVILEEPESLKDDLNMFAFAQRKIYYRASGSGPLTAFRPSVDTPLSSYSDMWRCAAIFGYVRRHVYTRCTASTRRLNASRHTSVNPRNALGIAMQYRAFKLFNAVSTLVTVGVHMNCVYIG